MSLKVLIKDGAGSGHTAQVTHSNELVVTGTGETQSKFQIINSTTVGFNYFPPLSDQIFVITTIIIDMTAAASIVIYEASDATTLTVDKTIFTAALAKNAFQAITLPFGGFIPITQGKYLNTKSDVQPVSVTIIGFYKGTHPHEGT